MSDLTFDDRELLRLLECMRPFLVQRARKWGQNLCIPEDVAQDAISKTWAHRSEMSGDTAKVKSYLIQSVKNHLADLGRRKLVRQQYSLEAMMDGVQDRIFFDGKDVTMKFATTELQSLISAWCLTKECNSLGFYRRAQAVAYLRMAGYTFDEISAMTGRTVPAVKSSYMRFQQVARELMGAEYGVDSA